MTRDRSAEGHRPCPACGGPQLLSARLQGGALVWSWRCADCGRVDPASLPPGRPEGT